MTRLAHQPRPIPLFGRREVQPRRRDPRPRSAPLLEVPAPGQAGRYRAPLSHDRRLAPALPSVGGQVRDAPASAPDGSSDLHFFVTSIAGAFVFFAAYLF